MNRAFAAAMAGVGMIFAPLTALAGETVADPLATAGATVAAGTPSEDPVVEGGGARVTVSRAADNVGRASYFSRARSIGSAGTIDFSSRELPSGAVFSASIPTPVLSRPGVFFGMPTGLPIAAQRISSGFGMRKHPLLGTLRAHDGIDLAAPLGTPVIATSDGVVTEADWRGGYGLMIALSHSTDVLSRYGHLSRLNVHAGQQVRKGEVIGFVGTTGESTGPHLHYEIRYRGVPVNPVSYAPGH